MDQFLENHKQPKLIHAENHQLTSPVATKESEFVVKKL